MQCPPMNHSFVVDHFDSNHHNDSCLNYENYSFLFMHPLSDNTECDAKLCMDGVWFTFGNK
jgi:hypothetical protein